MKWFFTPPNRPGNFVVYMQRNGMRLVTLHHEDLERQCFWLERLYVNFKTAEMWFRLPDLDHAQVEEPPK